MKKLITLLVFFKCGFILGQNVVYDLKCNQIDLNGKSYKEMVKEKFKGELQMHLMENGSLWLFDKTHAKLCGFIVDTSKTSCRQQLIDLVPYNDEKLYMYSQLDMADITFGEKGEIRKGWSEDKVKAVWGKPTEVVTDSEPIRIVKYGNKRRVTYQDGKVQSFLNL